MTTASHDGIPTTPTHGGTKMHPIAEKLNAVSKHLNSTYLERENAVHIMLLALLAKQHSYVLGPPGTGKSELTREFVRAIIGARYFEVGLSKTRPAEKVLGPLDIKKFREEGEYVLKRKGYLTDVELAFVDEVGKMSPVLGHDLLALFNERLIHEVSGGQSSHAAPLYTAFTASNEMITDESDDAAALWDRLLLRTTVDYLQNSDNFKRLLVAEMPSSDIEIEWADLKDVIDNVVPEIPCTESALDALVNLRHQFGRESLYPSDRRWRASMRVLQASAFLDGRDRVEPDDLAVLQYTLWDTPEQIDKVARLCLAAANPFVEPLLEIRDMIKEIDAQITERMGPDQSGNEQTEARQAYGKEAIKKLKGCRDRLDTMLIEAGDRRVPKFVEISDLHRRVLKRAFVDCLEQPDQVAESMMKDAGRLGMGHGGQSA